MSYSTSAGHDHTQYRSQRLHLEDKKNDSHPVMMVVRGSDRGSRLFSLKNGSLDQEEIAQWAGEYQKKFGYVKGDSLVCPPPVMAGARVTGGRILPGSYITKVTGNKAEISKSQPSFSGKLTIHTPLFLVGLWNPVDAGARTRSVSPMPPMLLLDAVQAHPIAIWPDKAAIISFSGGKLSLLPVDHQVYISPEAVRS